MATAQANLFDTPMPPPTPKQHWWRLQGQARRRGRRLEPLQVTPRFLARLDAPACPVTREHLAAGAGVVVALRDDADLAAGHLVTLGRRAAALAPGRWQAAWAMAECLADAAPDALEHGLDVGAWRRIALLRSFVQAPTPAEAAELPLVVLPPNRLRVLSAVQGLQVAMTLALRLPDRARRLTDLALRLETEESRLALRLFALTLVARRPAGLDHLDPAAARHALEDLWLDPLLQRRWRRLAQRLSDRDADALLRDGRASGMLGTGWRLLDDDWAIDGWGVPARPLGPTRHRALTGVPSPLKGSGMSPRERPGVLMAGRSQSTDDPLDAAVAPTLVAAPLLAAVRRRDGADADAEASALA